MLLKKRFLKKCLFIFLLLTVFTQITEAKNGIFITLESGWANQVNLPSQTAAGATSTQSNQFPSAYRLGVGYNHDFSFYPCLGIGLDIGVGQFGDTTYFYPQNKSEIRSRTLEFLALAMWHLKQWDIFGKAGGIRQTIIISLSEHITDA